MEKEGNILDLVFTTKEISEKYPVADCTIRTWIIDNVFTPNEFKKSGSTWVIKKEAILRVLKEKNMLQRTFVLGKEKTFMKHFAYKNDNFEAWYENDTTKDILENMPFAESIYFILDAYRKEKKMKFKYLLIDDNLREADNWLFAREKVWAITLKGTIEVLRRTLMSHKINVEKLDIYLEKNNISIS